MTVRDDIWQALIDGIGWEESLADAQGLSTPEGMECMAQARRYRAILKRRYGTSQTPMETAMEGSTYVSIDELRRRNENT